MSEKRDNFLQILPQILPAYSYMEIAIRALNHDLFVSDQTVRKYLHQLPFMPDYPFIVTLPSTRQRQQKHRYFLIPKNGTSRRQVRRLNRCTHSRTTQSLEFIEITSYLSSRRLSLKG